MDHSSIMPLCTFQSLWGFIIVGMQAQCQCAALDMCLWQDICWGHAERIWSARRHGNCRALPTAHASSAGRKRNAVLLASGQCLEKDGQQEVASAHSCMWMYGTGL